MTGIATSPVPTTGLRAGPAQRPPTETPLPTSASNTAATRLPSRMVLQQVLADEHGHHRVEAYVPDDRLGTRPIGKIIWRRGDGEVLYVETDDTVRRHGVATALWNEAHAYADRAELAKPRHSRYQTREGAAWALSVDSTSTGP